MSESILENMKGILFDPTSTFQSLRNETLGEALKYYAILLLIPTVLITLLFSVSGIASQDIPGLALMSGMGLFIGIIIFIMGIISVLINGLIYHILGVYIAGGREGAEQTIKALAYASTPILLLGWIPIINLIAGIWTLILFILGIRELQNLSTGRAVLVIILPIVIIAGIIVFSAVISVFIFGMAGSVY